MHFSLPILGWFEEDAPSEVVSFWAMESTAIISPMGDFDQEVWDFGILSTFFSWLIRYTRAMRCGCHLANPRSFTLTRFLVDPNLFAIFCWWIYPYFYPIIYSHSLPWSRNHCVPIFHYMLKLSPEAILGHPYPSILILHSDALFDHYWKIRNFRLYSVFFLINPSLLKYLVC